MTTADLQVGLFTDGAAKGNPGPAGIGIWMECNGVAIQEIGEYIGETTNNAAEYKALIRGLKLAQELGVARVDAFSDSELMVRQLNGIYRVKTPALKPLYDEARKLGRSFDAFQIQHVPRSENHEADRLANLGIQEGRLASGPGGRAH